LETNEFRGKPSNSQTQGVPLSKKHGFREILIFEAKTTKMQIARGRDTCGTPSGAKCARRFWNSASGDFPLQNAEFLRIRAFSQGGAPCSRKSMDFYSFPLACFGFGVPARCASWGCTPRHAHPGQGGCWGPGCFFGGFSTRAYWSAGRTFRARSQRSARVLEPPTTTTVNSFSS